MTQPASIVLKPFRDRIEEFDRLIVETVAQRLAVCREVAEIKLEHGIPMMQPDRVRQVAEAYAAQGKERGIAEDFLRDLAFLLIGQACRLEDEIICAGRESSL